MRWFPTAIRTSCLSSASFPAEILRSWDSEVQNERLFYERIAAPFSSVPMAWASMEVVHGLSAQPQLPGVAQRRGAGGGPGTTCSRIGARLSAPAPQQDPRPPRVRQGPTASAARGAPAAILRLKERLQRQ